MRSGLLVRDPATNRIKRCFPQAFGFRESETELNPTLSTTWVEKFDGDGTARLKSVLKAMRDDGLTASSTSALAIGNVGEIKATGLKHEVKLKIHNEPSRDNAGYAPIRGLPRDALALFEALAADVFSDVVTVDEIDR